MLLAGDIGGTKTLVGLFAPDGRRPRAVEVRSYATARFAGVLPLLDAFLQDTGCRTPIAAAAFGVAGPVVARTARLTNAGWTIAAAEIAGRLGTTRVALLNDLESMAHGLGTLDDSELLTLQEGQAHPDGNAVVIAAGTGLGQALLHRVNGRLCPVASEGGHADFAARSDREYELVRMLRDRLGRVEVEQVVSGRGLVNLHRFTHRGGICTVLGDVDLEAGDAPAQVSRSGLSGRCQFCADALRMFVAAYGAESGNLALRGVATGGVFIGGGIAPKIRPALESGTFMEAFRAKPPMEDLLARMPVRVILNPDTALLGAALHAQDLTRS
jgi:glucokinase